MRTVPTLLASGTGIALSAVGLVVVRTEKRDGSQPPPTALPDMTTVATYTATATVDHSTSTSPFTFARPQSRRRHFGPDDREDGRTRPSSVRIGRRSPTPRAHSGAGMNTTLHGDGEVVAHQAAFNSQSNTWLRRRLSRSMSTSRDSSRTPTSRPVSAAVTHTNGSISVPSTASTTSAFGSRTTTPLPPNKLVKRSSSVRSASGSPFQNSGSKLPRPIFRRPATSHQRAATLQNPPSSFDHQDSDFTTWNSSDARNAQWQHYFTPHITVDHSPSARRRSSTAIPNPIKRIYPDRKYTPVLVSTKTLVRPAGLELDDGFSEPGDGTRVSKLSVTPSVASSPPIAHASHFFEHIPGPRRAFSVGNLLLPNSQPLWRRPNSRGSTTTSPKFSRRGRSRVISAPLSHPVNRLSNDDEPPTKRRDMSDNQRVEFIYHSSSSNSLSETPPRLEIDRDLADSNRLSQYMTDSDLYDSQSSSDQQSLSLGYQYVPVTRDVRFSACHSDTPSTVGSESVRRSFGENSTDCRSDAAFDSVLTRTTRSSSGRRGPHIENIFDDSSPSLPSGRSTKLRDFLSDGHFPDSDHNAIYRHSTIEEEGSVVSTPVRSMRSKSITSTPSARPGTIPLFASSPPLVNIFSDPEEIDWDAPNDDEVDGGLGIRNTDLPSTNGNIFEKAPSFRFGPVLRFNGNVSTNGTPHRNAGSPPDRTNLFDWSEQQPSPSHPTNSPPRPRTVHGKKDQDRRVSRAAGRRPPSGMHARSHSVPIVPDVDGKRNNANVNKFGTWGVGSKAVTEDWNDDFEFDNPVTPEEDDKAADGKRVDSGHEMFVPKLIREQQQNVVANIELLREWGLLIEELKELRIRAVALDILHGQYAQAWREVDAMIELADQETEEHTLDPQRSPPSSPGFDFNAFDDVQHGLMRMNGINESPLKVSDSAVSSPNGSYPVFRASSHPNTPITTRPRKDSELVAQSVIAALQAKRNFDANGLQHNPPSRKVPFDTATLRHIVPYVRGLSRRVRDALRETEGLHLTTRRRLSPDNLDRRNHGSEDTDDGDLSVRCRDGDNHQGANGGFVDEDDCLSERMQRLTTTS